MSFVLFKACNGLRLAHPKFGPWVLHSGLYKVGKHPNPRIQRYIPGEIGALWVESELNPDDKEKLSTNINPSDVIFGESGVVPWPNENEFFMVPSSLAAKFNEHFHLFECRGKLFSKNKVTGNVLISTFSKCLKTKEYKILCPHCLKRFQRSVEFYYDWKESSEVLKAIKENNL